MSWRPGKSRAAQRCDEIVLWHQFITSNWWARNERPVNTVPLASPSVKIVIEYSP